MTAADLTTWARNFTELRSELDNYEHRADQAGASDPAAAARRGVGQLIGFQVGTLLRLAMPLIRQYGMAPPVEPIADAEHIQLMGRYVLELGVLQADQVPFDEARLRLGELVDQLADTATRWAASGVDQAEAEQFAAEARALTPRVEAAAARQR
ncbi:hypothetical protein NJ76_23970 [Rhodococcus sp. IITR03]|nr:hypothetical protein NJ76_23970 [Rhodococcus sp. IITR03]